MPRSLTIALIKVFEHSATQLSNSKYYPSQHSRQELAEFSHRTQLRSQSLHILPSLYFPVEQSLLHYPSSSHLFSSQDSQF